MKTKKRNSSSFILILSTCPSRALAKRVARRLVEEKLAACAQVVSSSVESFYRWKGKTTSGREWLLLIKTKAVLFDAVSREIKALHSFEVPEILGIPIQSGWPAYLSWLEGATKKR